MRRAAHPPRAVPELLGELGRLAGALDAERAVARPDADLADVHPQTVTERLGVIRVRGCGASGPSWTPTLDVIGRTVERGSHLDPRGPALPAPPTPGAERLVRRRRLREQGRRSLAANLAEGLALSEFLSKFAAPRGGDRRAAPTRAARPAGRRGRALRDRWWACGQCVGYLRGTQDVDLVPDPDPGNLDRLASVLKEAGGRVETARGDSLLWPSPFLQMRAWRPPHRRDWTPPGWASPLRSSLRARGQRWRRRIVTAATVVLDRPAPSRAALCPCPQAAARRAAAGRRRDADPDVGLLAGRDRERRPAQARPTSGARARPPPGGELGAARAATDGPGGAAQLERDEPAAEGQPGGHELDAGEGGPRRRRRRGRRRRGRRSGARRW